MKNEDSLFEHFTATCSKCGSERSIDDITTFSHDCYRLEGQKIVLSDKTERYSFCPDCLKQFKDWLGEKNGK